MSINILEKNRTYWLGWYGNLIVKVRWKIHQQMIGCSGILGGISDSEKVSFPMVTEGNDAI